MHILVYEEMSYRMVTQLRSLGRSLGSFRSQSPRRCATVYPHPRVGLFRISVLAWGAPSCTQRTTHYREYLGNQRFENKKLSGLLMQGHYSEISGTL